MSFPPLHIASHTGKAATPKDQEHAKGCIQRILAHCHQFVTTAPTPDVDRWYAQVCSQANAELAKGPVVLHSIAAKLGLNVPPAITVSGDGQHPNQVDYVPYLAPKFVTKVCRRPETARSIPHYLVFPLELTCPPPPPPPN